MQVHVQLPLRVCKSIGQLLARRTPLDHSRRRSERVELRLDQRLQQTEETPRCLGALSGGLIGRLGLSQGALDFGNLPAQLGEAVLVVEARHPVLIEPPLVLLLEQAAPVGHEAPFRQAVRGIVQLLRRGDTVPIDAAEPRLQGFPVGMLLWAYERSVRRYKTARDSLPEPDAFRLKYRSEIAEVMRHAVREKIRPTEAELARLAKSMVSPEDLDRFTSIALAELAGCTMGTSRDSGCGRPNSSNGRKDELLGAPYRSLLGLSDSPDQRYFEPMVAPSAGTDRRDMACPCYRRRENRRPWAV